MFVSPNNETGILGTVFSVFVQRTRVSCIELSVFVVVVVVAFCFVSCFAFFTSVFSFSLRRQTYGRTRAAGSIDGQLITLYP